MSPSLVLTGASPRLIDEWQVVCFRNQIDAAAQSLLTIKKEIEEDPKGTPPSILCVLCGLSNAVYQRPDGVFVVPITALKN